MRAQDTLTGFAFARCYMVMRVTGSLVELTANVRNPVIIPVLSFKSAIGRIPSVLEPLKIVNLYSEILTERRKSLTIAFSDCNTIVKMICSIRLLFKIHDKSLSFRAPLFTDGIVISLTYES